MDKLKRTSNILLLVAFAFFIKGYLDADSIIVLVGVFVLVIALSHRFVLTKLVDQTDDLESLGDDIIVKELKQDLPHYVSLLYAYQENDELLVDLQDGLLLYDSNQDSYFAKADTSTAREEILEKIPSDYTSFWAYDSIFEEAAGKSFQFSSKQSLISCVYEGKTFKIPEGATIQALSDQDERVAALGIHNAIEVLHEGSIGVVGQGKMGEIKYEGEEEALMVKTYIHELRHQNKLVFMLIDKADKAKLENMLSLGFVASEKEIIRYQ